MRYVISPVNNNDNTSYFSLCLEDKVYVPFAGHTRKVWIMGYISLSLVESWVPRLLKLCLKQGHELFQVGQIPPYLNPGVYTELITDFNGVTLGKNLANEFYGLILICAHHKAPVIGKGRDSGASGYVSLND